MNGKNKNRTIDLEELKELAVIGGNDSGNNGADEPYKGTSVICSIITVTTVSLLVSQTASCKEVC